MWDLKYRKVKWHIIDSQYMFTKAKVLGKLMKRVKIKGASS